MAGRVLLQNVFHVVRLKRLLELAPGHHVLDLNNIMAPLILGIVAEKVRHSYSVVLM